MNLGGGNYAITVHRQAGQPALPVGWRASHGGVMIKNIPATTMVHEEGAVNVSTNNLIPAVRGPPGPC